MKIDQTHTKHKRRWKIKDISAKNALQERFTDREGNEHSVASYFESKYEKLRYPSYPLVLIKTNPNLYLPMEVCFVAPNQRLVKLLNETQMSEAIKVASVSPDKHRQTTQQYMDNSKFDPRRIHDIQIETKMLELTARCIPPPQLAYLTEKRSHGGDTKTSETIETPRDGAWNMMRKNVIYGGELTCWGVLSLIDPAQRRCPCHETFVYIHFFFVSGEDIVMIVVLMLSLLAHCHSPCR
jgi:eukaryotic translation initiation factor 2C